MATVAAELATGKGKVNNMWAIQAQVEYNTGDGWHGSKSTPTFYLNGDVQGIVNEAQAIRIAREVVDPLRRAARVHISTVRV